MAGEREGPGRDEGAGAAGSGGDAAGWPSPARPHWGGPLFEGDSALVSSPRRLEDAAQAPARGGSLERKLQAVGATGRPSPPPRAQQAPADQERFEVALRELKTRLKFSESRARGAAEERDALRRRLLVETARAEEAVEEAARLREANREQARAARLLEEQFRESSLALEETLAGTSETEGRLGARLRRKEMQLEEATERGRGREELIRHLEGQLAGVRRRVAVAEQRGQHLDAVNADLSRELVASKQELQKLFNSRLAHLKTIDASEQAVRDNARLLKILRSAANVCKPLGDLLDDWDDSGGATYVAGSTGSGGVGPDGTATVGGEVFSALEAHYASVVVDDPSEVGRVRIEALKWAPAEAQEEVREFWRRLGNTLPWQPFAELLHRLDKVWRERELRKLVRVTTAHQRKVQELRARLKRMSGRLNWDLSEGGHSEVNRLRRKLKEAAPGASPRQQRRSDDPTLQTSLKAVERLSQQLAAVLEENEELRRGTGHQGAADAYLEEAGTGQGTAGPGGDIYFAKGAAWQGGRDAAVIEELAGRVAAIRAQVSPRIFEAPGRQGAGGATLAPLDSLDQVEEAVEVARQKVQRRAPLLSGSTADPLPYRLPSHAGPVSANGVIDGEEMHFERLHSLDDSFDAWERPSPRPERAGAGGTATAPARDCRPPLSSDEDAGNDSDEDAQEWSQSVQRVRRAPN